MSDIQLNTSLTVRKDFFFFFNKKQKQKPDVLRTIKKEEGIWGNLVEMCALKKVEDLESRPALVPWRDVCEFRTLSPAAADFAKQSAMTQTIQSLLPDQLQQLWLQTLFQLAAQIKPHTHTHTLLKGMVWQRISFTSDAGKSKTCLVSDVCFFRPALESINHSDLSHPKCLPLTH